MRISVIVPTYRRPRDLARCLTALDAQTRLPDQVIVIRRDDDFETRDVLAALALGIRLTVRTVNVPGVVAALNVGLAEAEGDIVAFTDDDAAPRPQWLATIERHFASRPEIGGVGGRDYIAGWSGSGKQRVGKIQWFGRLIHEHHLGVGEPRYVDFLKGVNMSYRREAIEGIRFDTRLRGSGAQVHNEMMFSLEVSRAGWKLWYDPAVAVDHYPAPRFDEDRRFRPSLKAIYDSAFNETLTLLEHLSAPRRVAFMLFSLAYGTRDTPGLGQCLRLCWRRPQIWLRLTPVVRARLAALKAVR
jgi:cellulose synthase/poly-beta-1,6-N-acetylglucosamine synthase-like glycosyltransferase